jgi:hypothetical protein
VSDSIGVVQTSRRNATHALTVGVLVVTASAAGWVGCSSEPGSTGGDAIPSADAAPEAARGEAAPDATNGDAAQDSPAAVDADSSDGLVSSPACITYCNTMQTMCNVDYQQFATTHSCLVACSYYPPGTDADPLNAGNTLKCRQTHAEAGGGHCLHGGPYGYGGCGFMCESFCQIAMTWCAASAGGAPFASPAACISECEGWAWAPNGPDGAAAFRATTPTTGNTLDCREVQLVKSLESKAARDVYCPLAATNSTTCL